MDAAHGGWLGWLNNMQKYLTLVKTLDIATHLRGFSTNVANYQQLGSKMCPYDETDGASGQNTYCLNRQHDEDECCDDPCALEGQYNAGNTELNYANLLYINAINILEKEMKMIIDTGRNNPVDPSRKSCANWCNIYRAGVGTPPPTSDTYNNTVLDAYYWLKTPGESDGCSAATNVIECSRHDDMCNSADSICKGCNSSISDMPDAPEAGKWFDYGMYQLVMNGQYP